MARKEPLLSALKGERGAPGTCASSFQQRLASHRCRYRSDRTDGGAALGLPGPAPPPDLGFEEVYPSSCPALQPGRAGLGCRTPPWGRAGVSPGCPVPSPCLGTHGCCRSLSSPQERCCGCGRVAVPARTPLRTSCPSASCWRASCARGSDVSDPSCPGGGGSVPGLSARGPALLFSRRTGLGLPETGLLALA